MTLLRRIGWSLSFGPRELEEPGDDLVEPFDFARNDVHVLGEVERLARSAARRRDDDRFLDRSELLLQQLEVNGHRVERFFTSWATPASSRPIAAALRE